MTTETTSSRPIAIILASLLAGASAIAADIIAVSADPLADVRALEHVDFVMRSGTVDKQ